MNLTNITWYNPNTMIIDEKELFKTIIDSATNQIFYVSLTLIIFLFLKLFIYDVLEKYLNFDYQTQNKKHSINPYKTIGIIIDGVTWLCALYIFNIMFHLKFS